MAGALARDERTGFLAGAVYAAFPASNGALFWAIGTAFYHFQTLGLLWWLEWHHRKLWERQDYRFGGGDFARLLAVAYTGEQILPALVAMLPLTWWLVGRRREGGRFWRFWLTQMAVLAVLLGVYVGWVNRVSVFQGIGERYGGAPWSLRAPAYFLLGALGLKPDFAGWRVAWEFRPELVLFAGLAVAAFWWGRRGCGRNGPERRLGELLLWSTAAVILTYLPLARINGFEWRYLYVSSPFLAAAGVALLRLLGERAAAATALLATVYGVGVTFFEIRHCWVPAGRAAVGIRRALAAAAPYRHGEVFVFSGEPVTSGTASAFITRNSWNLNHMLAVDTGAAEPLGARDLFVDEQGHWLLHNRDSFRPYHAEYAGRLRVFVREGDRFAPRSILAAPVSADRFRLAPLRDYAAALLPAGEFTREELLRQPFGGEIYFARWVPTGVRPDSY